MLEENGESCEEVVIVGRGCDKGRHFRRLNLNLS